MYPSYVQRGTCSPVRKLGAFDYLKGEVANGSFTFGAPQGEKNITEAWIRKHETTVKNADRTIAFWKRQISLGFGDTMRAFDCLYSPHCGDMDVETAFPQDILDTG